MTQDNTQTANRQPSQPRTNEQRYLHILAGGGPDFVYECRNQFDLLTQLAPPVELLQALQRQETRGSVPESTAAWAARWRALERAEVAK